MSNNIIEVLLLAVYTFFAVRWGMGFVDGRWAWLEQPDLKIVKIIIAIIVGFVLFTFYIVLHIAKFVGFTLPRWLS